MITNTKTCECKTCPSPQNCFYKEAFADILVLVNGKIENLKNKRSKFQGLCNKISKAKALHILSVANKKMVNQS